MDSSKEEQFSKIYDEYIGKIYRFVYLKVSSQEIAEDITSKVFLNGWKSYQKQPERIQNTRAFLYQIARNMVSDHYRDRGRTKIVSADNIPQMADGGTSLHERAVISSDIEMMKTAMRGLKQEYQDVLIWRYLDDMTVPEIAGILNRPEGTVRVMIHRGLSTLRNELKREA